MSEEAVGLNFGNDEESISAMVALYRGLILAGYANVEFVLTDLLVRCSNVDFYSDIIPVSLPYQMAKRLACLRSILRSPGPFLQYQPAMLPLVNRLIDFEELRHMMTHGLMVLRFDIEEPIQSRVTFRRYDFGSNKELILHTADLSLEDLGTKQLQVTRYSHEVVALMWRVLEETNLPPPPGSYRQ